MLISVDQTLKVNTYKELTLDTLIFPLFYCIVLVDLINGYFINSGIHLPVAQIYKLLLIFLLTIRVFSGRYVNKQVLFAVFYTFFFGIYYFITQGTDLLSDSIIHLTKLVFIILSYAYFSHGIKTDQDFFFKKMMVFAKISLSVFCVSLFFGVFGFGFSSYSDESSVGNKSYFNGANDLGVALVTVFSFFIYYISYIKYKKVLKYPLFALITFLAISVSTKMVMLGTIVSLFVLPYKAKNANSPKIRSKVKNFLVFALVLTLGLFIFGYIISKTPIFERLQNYYQLNDLAFVIFSGRLDYLENNIGVFFKSNYFIQFFGLGGDRTIELDFFDVLLNYGYFGLIWVYYFYGSLLKKALKRSKDKLYPFAPYIVYINILLSFVSFLAGHVLFSAMGGVFISFVNSLTFYKGEIKPVN